MTDYKDLLAVKFTPHGRSVQEGFDCYGLAIEVLKRNGIILNDIFYDDIDDYKNITESAFLNTQIINVDNLEENCIILISVNGNPTHIAVYIGEGLLIHATENQGVVIQPVHRYERRIVGLYKVVNQSLQKRI